jgi:hypothetical protein
VAFSAVELKLIAEMAILGPDHAEERESGFAETFERRTYSNLMKQSESEAPKYGTYLKGLSTEEIEKLLSSVLQEMRRRDSERVKGDVVANSRALRKFRPCD